MNQKSAFCKSCQKNYALQLSDNGFSIQENFIIRVRLLLSLKQVHQVASKYVKLQTSTSRSIKVHQAATKYIKMHPGTSSCIKGHLEHPAASRVILGIHKNVLVHQGTTCASIDIQDIQMHPGTSSYKQVHQDASRYI